MGEQPGAHALIDGLRPIRPMLEQMQAKQRQANAKAVDGIAHLKQMLEEEYRRRADTTLCD